MVGEQGGGAWRLVVFYVLQAEVPGGLFLRPEVPDAPRKRAVLQRGRSHNPAGPGCPASTACSALCGAPGPSEDPASCLRLPSPRLLPPHLGNHPEAPLPFC